MRASVSASRERAALERGARLRPWPLPVRGWHGDIDYSEVDPSYAPVLRNLWFKSGRLRTRPGYAQSDATIARQRVTHALGSATPVTILVGASQMTVGAKSLARVTPGRVMAAQISNNTIMVDGAAAMVRWDGLNLEVPSFTTGAGETPPQAFDGVVAHQDRLFFWKQDGPLEFWYGGLGAVTGQLTKFPLGRLGSISGGIVAMGRVTLDAGTNVNDLLAILTSEGDAVFYEGTDPGDATAWRIYGRMRIAPPVGPHALYNHGADLYVVTAQGLVAMSQVLGRGAPAMLASMTAPVREALQAEIDANPSSQRWQMIAPPSQEYLLLNTPAAGGRAFVYQPDLGGWLEWTGIDALNWSVRGGDLFATLMTGREIRVINAAGDAGTPITSTWWTAWTAMGGHVQMIQPRIRHVGDMSLSVTLLADGADTARDVSEATQTITLRAENEGDGSAQVYAERVACGLSGETHQLRLSFTATDAEVIALKWSR